LLEKYEANLSIVNDLRMSLLHFAAQGDKINTMLYLHDKQFNINEKDSKNSTPLHWACYSGSEKIV
jgi:ankyrin repeat protein